MSLREAIEQNKAVSSAVVIAMVAAAIFLIIHQNESTSAVTRMSKDFYTSDDGKSYFVDDADKVVPYDHDGAQAVRAHVFKCSGQTFVGYMERYKESARQRITQLKQQQASGADVTQQLIDAAGNASEIKRPGDAKWVSPNSLEGAAVATPKCPSGGTIEGVVP